jgi:negative regulator of sigma E activity
VLLALGFGVIAAPIALGLLHDVRTVRTRALVPDIKAAEENLAFTAVRTLTGDDPSGAPVTVVQRVHGAPGGKRLVELVSVEGGDSKKRRTFDFSPFTIITMVQAAASGPGLRPSGIINKFGDPDLVLRNYEIRSAGAEVVAGRPAEIFDIAARHPGRASYRVWTDRENRFPLRWQVRQGGATMFEISHRSIVFEMPTVKFVDRRPFDLFELFREGDVKAEEFDVHLRFPTFLPTRLPAGFVRCDLAAVRAKLPGVKDPFRALTATYTDGLSKISILESNHRFMKELQAWLAGLAEPPKVGRGQIVAQRVSGPGGAAIRLTIDGTEIIVSGSVSPEDLENVVRSLDKTGGME